MLFAHYREQKPNGGILFIFCSPSANVMSLRDARLDVNTLRIQGFKFVFRWSGGRTEACTHSLSTCTPSPNPRLRPSSPSCPVLLEIYAHASPRGGTHRLASEELEATVGAAGTSSHPVADLVPACVLRSCVFSDSSMSSCPSGITLPDVDEMRLMQDHNVCTWKFPDMPCMKRVYKDN